MRQIKHHSSFYLEETAFMSSYEFVELKEEIMLQYITPKHHFFDYLSRQYRYVPEDVKMQRQFVLRFKDGIEDAQDAASRFVADYIISEHLDTDKYTFVCLPASSKAKNELRYKNFMRMVTKRTRNINGYNLVEVTSDRNEVHTGGSRSAINFKVSSEVSGKKLIVFDDVETTGMSFARFAAQLEAQGAEVVQAVFLAKAISF